LDDALGDDCAPSTYVASEAWAIAIVRREALRILEHASLYEVRNRVQVAGGDVASEP
jgi:hypothetical protein